MDYEIYNYSRGAIVERICTKTRYQGVSFTFTFFVVDMS